MICAALIQDEDEAYNYTICTACFYSPYTTCKVAAHLYLPLCRKTVKLKSDASLKPISAHCIPRQHHQPQLLSQPIIQLHSSTRKAFMIALEGLWPFVSALPCRALDIAITSEVRSEIWLTFVAELPSAEWPVLGLLLPICSAEIQRPGHIRPFAADRGLVPPALIALPSSAA